MGFKLLQACIDRRFDDLSDSEWLTLLALCRYADDVKGGNCYPSTETLSLKSRLSPNVVRRSIKALEGKQWISTRQAPGGYRYFFVDAPRVLSAPLLTRDMVDGEDSLGVEPGKEFAPGKEIAPGKKLDPLADVQPLSQVKPLSHVQPLADVQVPPLQMCNPSPCRSASRREHIKEQRKEHIASSADGAFSKPLAEVKPLSHVQPLAEVQGGETVTALPPTAQPAEADLPNFGLTTDEPKAEAPKRKPKAKTFLLPHKEIPEAWAKLCSEVRPDLDPKRVFVSFRFYFTEGRGAGTMRSERGWAQCWSNWLSREKERAVNSRGSAASASPLPPHKDPAFHFDEEYYKKSIKPDGSVDWGF